MPDELISAVLKASGLRVLVATVSELAQVVGTIQHATPTSTAVLGEALCGAVLVAALQKEQTRINLQVECDGPMRGFFVDASSDGFVRGYVKNPNLAVAGTEERRWRPVLGNSGFLSVIRDIGDGEHYRSSIELLAFDLGRDLERYFEISEQIPTALALAKAEQPVRFAGILIQPLPDGDRDVLREERRRLVEQGTFARAVEQDGSATASSLLTTLFSAADVDVMGRAPLAFRCGCSLERVRTALIAVGKTELEDMLAKEGKAEITCQFCMTLYLIPGEDIRALLEAASR